MTGSLPSGRVFYDEERVNLYHLNSLYASLAKEVSEKMRAGYGLDVPITSGIWGGTYLITAPDGKSLRRIWRLYCIVNLPQNGSLDQKQNLERLIAIYSDAFIKAFMPYKIELELKMWGGRLPFSNKKRPSFTLHMEDHKDRVRWLRAFFVWNTVPWEESVISDTVRIIKEYKEYFDLDRAPVKKDPQDIKYLLQDIIIIYRTLENACSDDFREHADPIIEELTAEFIKGLHDPEKIEELYLMVYHNALIYGFEESLAEPFGRAGLDISKLEDWPVEKINWLPQELKDKLIPPIKNIFSGFQKHLEARNNH